MKPFMIRHKCNWLPKKLYYGKTYWIGFIAAAHEGFIFKLSRNSSHVLLKDNQGTTVVICKRELKKIFKEGLLQFAIEISPEE